MRKESFAGRKVLIMGLGRFGGGVDAAKFACDAGAKVIITDLALPEQLRDSLKQLKEYSDIEYHLGSHNASDFEQADIIIVNPAVSSDSEFLKHAREHDKFITSQIGVFFELCPAPIIGITGANGKSTTAALTAHLLRGTRDEGRGTRDEGRETRDEGRETRDERRQKTVLWTPYGEDRSQVSAVRRPAESIKNVWLSGNIGNEPLLTVVDEIGADDLVVLELSSFQIEQLAEIEKAPHAALLTNLTPNHLDRYGTFAAYCAAKENIFKFQELDQTPPAVSIFNAEDKIGAEWYEKYKTEAGRICIKFSTDDVREEIRDRFSLPGRANLSNLAAAVAIARYFGIKDDWIKKCLPDFKGLPHRLELAAEINGVRWYNDSKATTPEGAVSALDAFEVPKIIIAGGYDKHIPFDGLGKKIAQEAKAAILLGQTAERIANAIGACSKSQTKIKTVGSLGEAVDLARQLATSGDVVLLSPACASYDMFDNFQQRGQEFVRLVCQIAG